MPGQPDQNHVFLMSELSTLGAQFETLYSEVRYLYDRIHHVGESIEFIGRNLHRLAVAEELLAHATLNPMGGNQPPQTECASRVAEEVSRALREEDVA